MHPFYVFRQLWLADELLFYVLNGDAVAYVRSLWPKSVRRRRRYQHKDPLQFSEKNLRLELQACGHLMVMYYLEPCWCSLMWLYFPIPCFLWRGHISSFQNHNRFQTIILLPCEQDAYLSLEVHSLRQCEMKLSMPHLRFDGWRTKIQWLQ